MSWTPISKPEVDPVNKAQLDVASAVKTHFEVADSDTVQDVQAKIQAKLAAELPQE